MSPRSARLMMAGCSSPSRAGSSLTQPTTGFGTRPAPSPCRPPSATPRSRKGRTTFGARLSPPGCARGSIRLRSPRGRQQRRGPAVPVREMPLRPAVHQQPAHGGPTAGHLRPMSRTKSSSCASAVPGVTGGARSPGRRPERGDRGGPCRRAVAACRGRGVGPLLSRRCVRNTRR